LQRGGRGASYKRGKEETEPACKPGVAEVQQSRNIVLAHKKGGTNPPRRTKEAAARRKTLLGKKNLKRKTPGMFPIRMGGNWGETTMPGEEREKKGARTLKGALRSQISERTGASVWERGKGKKNAGGAISKGKKESHGDVVEGKTTQRTIGILRVGNCGKEEKMMA